MRLPLPPATLRAGGRISAGMISTVHTPLPICEAIAPKVWPQRCAPSPESLTISTMCSLSVTAVLPLCAGRSGFARARARLDGDVDGLGHLATLGGANAREVAFPQIDPEERAGAGIAGLVVARNRGFSR